MPQINDANYRGAMFRLDFAESWCEVLKERHPDEMSVWKIEENVLRAIELLKTRETNNESD